MKSISRDQRLCPKCGKVIGYGCICQDVCAQTVVESPPSLDIQPHPVIAMADRASTLWPANAARFEKAANLVAGGRVDLFETEWQRGWPGMPVGRVWSQTSDGEFYILRRVELENAVGAPLTRERTVVSCSCHDYQAMHAPVRRGQRFCKHVAAYRMAARLAAEGEAALPEEARFAAATARRRAQQRFLAEETRREVSQYELPF